MSYAPIYRGNRSATGGTLPAAFDLLRSDYSAAKASRFRRRRTGLAPSGSGADFHYRSESDYLKLMENARDMDRNDAVVGQMIDRAVNNTIQDGITPAAMTGDPKLDKDLDDRWTDWANDPEQCDFSGEMTYRDMQHAALRASFVDGDMISLGDRNGSIRLIEAHRVRTPRNTTRNVIHGVLLDERRRRLQYWVTRDDLDPSRSLDRVSDVAAFDTRDELGDRQVFHLYNPKRVTQTRGVTAFAPIFDVLGMFEDIQFAKLVQQQVVSCFAILRQRSDDFQAVGDDGQTGERETIARADGSTQTVDGIGPGMTFRGAPGETLAGFSPSVPNAEFFDHVRLILTLAGVNVGMPLVMVLMDASETNFSGYRGAIDQARMGFRRNQRCVVDRWSKPHRRWKINQWLADDRALRRVANRRNINIHAHRWNAPNWPYIEPLKDASSDLLRVSNGLISPSRLQAERGRQWDEIASETVRDYALAVRLAKTEAMAINQQFNDDQPVHWRDLINLPTADGVAVQLRSIQSVQGDDSTNQTTGSRSR